MVYTTNLFIFPSAINKYLRNTQQIFLCRYFQNVLGTQIEISRNYTVAITEFHAQMMLTHDP